MNKRIICLLLAGVLTFASSLSVLATSVSEVQQEKKETQNRLNEINESISAIESKQNEIRAELGSLNAELVDTLLTLELLEADLERKQEEIDEAQAQYDQLKALEEEQYHAMKLRIQYMYEYGNVNYVTMLLEAESISDFLNRADFAQEVSDYDDTKLTEYQETKNMVAETKAVLEEEQAELEEVQEAQQIYKADLDKKIASAKTKSDAFETELANAQAKAKEYQQTIKEQNAKIEKLQKEEEERLKAEAAAREESATESGSESGDTGDAGTGAASANDTTSSGTGSTTTASGSGTGAAIANYALQFVGNPYVSGGTSLTNGADCSGFTQSVHKHFGISIPRVSRDQAKSGKSVSISAIQAGDILYYGNHVGIYIGNGQIVHASNERTGIKVSNYTYRTPICARRYW